MRLPDMVAARVVLWQRLGRRAGVAHSKTRERAPRFERFQYCVVSRAKRYIDSPQMAWVQRSALPMKPQQPTAKIARIGRKEAKLME